MFFSALDSFSLGPFDILHAEKIPKKLRYFRLPPNFGPWDVKAELSRAQRSTIYACKKFWLWENRQLEKTSTGFNAK